MPVNNFPFLSYNIRSYTFHKWEERKQSKEKVAPINYR